MDWYGPPHCHPHCDSGVPGMSFATPMFLWAYLPLVLVLTWLLPARLRNAIVAVASLLFYSWGGGPFVFLLLLCIAVNYGAGLLVDRERSAPQASRRALLL